MAHCGTHVLSHIKYFYSHITPNLCFYWTAYTTQKQMAIWVEYGASMNSTSMFLTLDPENSFIALIMAVIYYHFMHADLFVLRRPFCLVR